jgi:enamine deaminase RidA (YjgF/YER057c/UK114 family)
MKKLFFTVASFCTVVFSFAMADTAFVNNKGELVIETNTYTKHELKNGRFKKLVYYVDVPPTVASPPNNGAYSSAAITKDFIFFSGVTGQDLNGDPVPLGPNGITQITQAYANMQAILKYFKLPVTQVTKLDVSVEAQDRDTFLTYRSTANVVQSAIWKKQPPRTIQAVNFLNLGVLEVTFTARNPYPLKVRSVL